METEEFALFSKWSAGVAQLRLPSQQGVKYNILFGWKREKERKRGTIVLYMHFKST